MKFMDEGGLGGFSPEIIEKATEGAPAAYSARPGEENDRVERAVTEESLVGKDDKRIFGETQKELGEKLTDDHRQTLIDLIHSREKPGRNWQGDVVNHLAVHADQIRRAEPEKQREQMRVLARGYVGEQANALFGLRDSRVKTPVNINELWTVTDQFKRVEMVATGRQAPISRQLDFLNRMVIESVLTMESDPSLYAPGVTPENVGKLGRPLVLGENSQIVPNPAIYNRENPRLAEIMVEQQKLNVPDKLLRDDNSGLTVGFLEMKAYSPAEIRDMVKAGANNTQPGELGGRVGDKNLVVRVDGERRFVEEMVNPNELSAKPLVAVVRFLGDAPADALSVLEYQAHKKGLGPIVFQTLPLTNEELSVLVAKTLDKISVAEVEARARGFAANRENRVGRAKAVGVGK